MPVAMWAYTFCGVASADGAVPSADVEVAGAVRGVAIAFVRGCEGVVEHAVSSPDPQVSAPSAVMARLRVTGSADCMPVSRFTLITLPKWGDLSQIVRSLSPVVPCRALPLPGPGRRAATAGDA